MVCSGKKKNKKQGFLVSFFIKCSWHTCEISFRCRAVIWQVCTLCCAHPKCGCHLSPHNTMTIPWGSFHFDSDGVLPGSSTFMVLRCVFQNSWSAGALKVCSLHPCLKPHSPGVVPVSLRHSNFWHLEWSSIHVSLTPYQHVLREAVLFKLMGPILSQFSRLCILEHWF